MITKKCMLMQERQRSAEALSLKETVRRLQFENEEVCLCDHKGHGSCRKGRGAQKCIPQHLRLANKEVCLCDHKEGHAHAGEAEVCRHTPSRRLSDICDSKIKRYVLLETGVISRGYLLCTPSRRLSDAYDLKIKRYVFLDIC